MRSTPLLLLLAACGGPEYAFTEVEPAGAAVSSVEDGGAMVRKDAFELGGDARTPLVDILFVVDNSVSMNAVLPQFQKGFDALATDAAAFGERARIGVITTLPADPDVPGALHPAVSTNAGLEFDPGFGGLVDARRLQDYRLAAPRMKARMPLTGCDGWFAPAATNRGGVSCLVAHTQVGLSPVGAEAGLVAFDQLLDRDDFGFRPGAAVNVVFVSDTHDPGLPPDHSDAVADLVGLRPTAASLAAKVEARFGTSAFRIHAIAPQSLCTTENWEAIGPVYHQAAEATGGVSIDICTAEDYRPLLEQVARAAGKPTRPVLALGRDAEEVLSVTVDGTPAGFLRLDQAVELDAMPEAASQVEVTYRYAARTSGSEQSPPSRPRGR